MDTRALRWGMIRQSQARAPSRAEEGVGVVEPNRLGAPGEAQARARVETLFARIDALDAAHLAMLALPMPGAERAELLRAAQAAADRSGRAGLLEEARRGVRDALSARALNWWPVDAAGTPIRPAGRPQDQAAVTAALEDAVAAAVVEDVLDPETADALAARGRDLLGLSGPVRGPAGEPRGRGVPGDDPPWAPAAEEWAAAEADAARSAADRESPGMRPAIRIGLMVLAAGVVLVLVILLAGGGPV